MTAPSFVLGTRGSDLALWQAHHVMGRLGGEAAGVRLEIIKTEGDRAFDRDLAAQGDRGLFTRDIEEALLAGRIDAAVHSLKDLPTIPPEGLELASVPERAAPGDVIFVRPDAVADDERLPVRRGARVGTGSPRRVAQLMALRPDLVTGPFRGNVPTRLDKCRRGDVDAVILARAGVERLGLDIAPLVAFDLDPASWLPAPAQGALGLQARAGDAPAHARLGALAHAPTRACIEIERGLLRILEAGCHAALGAWARPEGGGFRLDAGLLDGDTWRRLELAGPADGLAAEAAERLRRGEGATGVRPGAWTRR